MTFNCGHIPIYFSGTKWECRGISNKTPKQLVVKGSIVTLRNGDKYTTQSGISGDLYIEFKNGWRGYLEFYTDDLRNIHNSSKDIVKVANYQVDYEAKKEFSDEEIGQFKALYMISSGKAVWIAKDGNNTIWAYNEEPYRGHFGNFLSWNSENSDFCEDVTSLVRLPNLSEDEAINMRDHF